MICPYCGYARPDSQAPCPHCGNSFLTNADNNPLSPYYSKTSSPSGGGVMFFLAAVICVCVIVIIYSTNKDVKKNSTARNTNAAYTQTYSRPQNAVAYEFAKRFVLQRLKAPSTAKFAPYSESKISPLADGATYKVTSYVDSQNSFGAMIRTYWYAKIIYTRAFDEWKILDIDFLGN